MPRRVALYYGHETWRERQRGNKPRRFHAQGDPRAKNDTAARRFVRRRRSCEENSMAGKRDLFINGQWSAAKSKATFPVHNPSTGEVWAKVADAGRADAAAAIEAAAEAQ